MNITGTVLNKDLNKQIKGTSGVYTGWELTYQKEDGTIDSIKKPIQSLRNPKMVDVKTALDDLQEGDKFTAVMEKEGNFWELKQLVKGDVILPMASQARGGFHKAPTKEFETREERQLRQKLIVRQSSLTTAIQLAEAAKLKVNKDEILKLAEDIETWVFRDN